MFSLNEYDNAAIGGVYLCQVKEHVSCGACCGLYNVADASRAGLIQILADRTRRFSEIPRDVDGILGFAEETGRRESPVRPYPEFHHCPYIGLVGAGKSRVGCLLHPLADGNAGIDFRGLSYYGGMACRTYFCPSCKSLDPVYKRILRSAADDWYSYGLIMTETVLVDAFFGELERRAGRPIAPEDVVGIGLRENPIRRFIHMRATWPFRAAPERPGNYFFEDRRYPRPPVDERLVNRLAAGLDGLAAKGSEQTYLVLFRELESSFASDRELEAAISMFERLFASIVRRIHAPRHINLPDG